MRFSDNRKSRRACQRVFLFLPFLWLGACASQPRPPETVWVTVVDVYSANVLVQGYNESVRDRFRSAGFSGRDIEQGSLLRVACGLGTDYSWGSYAYLPPQLKAKKEEVLRLKINDTGTDDRMAINPILEPVESFKWPGRLPAYRYIPDWKERNLFLNFERIPLEPAQDGRYVVTHGAYLIKCRQPGEP